MKPIVCVAMNRAFILFILSLFSFSIYAQNIRVESFSIVMNDATASASPVLDANDDPCALIRLVTTDKEYEIDGNIKRVEKTGELLFYVPSGTRQVTIRHSSLGVLNYSFEQRLQSKTTYRMVLPSNTIVIHSEDRGGHYLVMNITPANAVVHIDGMLENVRDGLLQKFLPYGMHTYRVEAPLYSMEEGSVEIGREKKQLDISLKPNFANVTLKAQGAEIKVNSESKGNGSWSGRLNPGTYLVETVKPGYRNASYTLVVVSGEDRSVDLPMPTPMYASLDVSSNAVNGSVYVDGKHIGNTPDIFKVLAGKHTVELRANGYESKSYTVEMAEGEAKKLFAELKETAKSTYGGQATTASQGGNVISKPRDPNELLCIACANKNDGSIAYFTGGQWEALAANEKSRYAQLGVSIKKNGHEFIIAAKDCQDPEDGDYKLMFGGYDIDFAGVRNYENWDKVREAYITTGYSDTNAIIEQTKGKTDSKGIKGAPAAEAAWNYKANSHDGLQWYLPSFSEFNMIYMDRGKINSFLNKYFTDYNSIPAEWYWSSTEYYEGASWNVTMYVGNRNYYYNRLYSYRVRAVAVVK